MIDEEKEQGSNLNRRAFIGTAAAAGAVLVACGGAVEEKKAIKLGEKIVRGPQTAPDGPVIRAGVIGCGGRGTGAAGNFLDAGPSLEVVALADTFEDRVENCRAKLREQYDVEIPDERCYVGFDGYKQLLESEVDYIIIATPPFFRPAIFEAAVEARKNIFMEKPVAVDPVGIRSILATSERADALGLKIVTGTQRHHEASYIETYNRIMDGAIGHIVAARCYWNQGQLWFREHQDGWSDMEWMIRDWVNWCWASGDHIVEQHIHNIDVINWFTNSHPTSAVGMGGRQRRVTGDQYDFFSVDYEFENGMHNMSMCRQIDGCVNNVSEFIVGESGSSNCKDTIFGPGGEVVWSFDPTEGGAGEEGPQSPYIQEHTDLITAIRNDQPVNEVEATAFSNMTAIMGRVSAYTGQEVTWDEMMASDLQLGPETLELGPSELIDAVIPVPGTSKV
jgi:predicted dehydrogenase